jgi:signal transduction histidine kinase/DNA-binding response OmpR family regulator
MKRVLLVEDDQDNLYYLRALLEGHGWAVDSAIHGADGLQKARVLPPDLVISDLLMPVMDGYTLLRNWKMDARLADVPFIVYTATYTDADDERLALSLGADAFVLKPCEPKEFLIRVQKVLARALAGGPSVPSSPAVEEEKARLELYSATLIRKLEQKTLELEQTNRALQEDIVQRELVERKLRHNEVLLGMAGRVARLGGWSLDVPDRVTWSEEVCRIHEVAPDSVCNLEQALAFHAPEFAGTLRAQIESCVREGTPFDLESQITTATGRRIWVRAMGHAEPNACGPISRLECVFQDIDEQRDLREQLRQAQKMDAIGQLAGGVAHDFNNLLSVILGYASVALEDLKAGDPVRADIEEVLRAGERATALTRQLLAFGRKQLLRPQVLDVGQVVSAMEKMFSRVLGEDIELSLCVGRPLGSVHADASQVEQIVMNLIVNARDAMPRGGTLSIDIENVDLDVNYAYRHDIAPGSYVMLAVTDTGTGMDAATRERIFEPFFTTKEQGKGTGLGLSTVFGIVKQSAGHISVQTELERGTSMKIYLPCTGQTLPSSPSSPPPPATLRGSETVLLVEDDEQVRVLMRTILRRHGYNVLEAQNGGEAFLICEKYAEKIDLLVTDVVMPRMSGRELAERLGVMRPELSVLYVSGYTEKAIAEDGVLDPELAFFQKPVIPALFLRKLREVLDARAAARTSTKPRAEPN